MVNIVGTYKGPKQEIDDLSLNFLHLTALYGGHEKEFFFEEESFSLNQAGEHLHILFSAKGLDLEDGITEDAVMNLLQYSEQASLACEVRDAETGEFLDTVFLDLEITKDERCLKFQGCA